MSQGARGRKSPPGLGGPLISLSPLLSSFLLQSCLLGEGRTQTPPPDLSSLQSLPSLPVPSRAEGGQRKQSASLAPSLWLSFTSCSGKMVYSLAPPPPPWQNLALVSGFCRAPRVKRLGSNWTLYFSPVHPSHVFPTPYTRRCIEIAPPCVEILIFRW